MTSPAKPPAPMEPILSSRTVHEIAYGAAVNEDGDVKMDGPTIGRILQSYEAMERALSESRRAAPAPSDGEVGGSIFPKPPGIMRCGLCGHRPHRSLRCGFLLRPDLDDGMGEARCECIQCEADTAFPGYDDLIPALLEARAALDHIVESNKMVTAPAKGGEVEK